MHKYILRSLADAAAPSGIGGGKLFCICCHFNKEWSCCCFPGHSTSTEKRASHCLRAVISSFPKKPSHPLLAHEHTHTHTYTVWKFNFDAGGFRYTQQLFPVFRNIIMKLQYLTANSGALVEDIQAYTETIVPLFSYSHIRHIRIWYDTDKKGRW